jgi:hypothetical protein
VNDKIEGYKLILARNEYKIEYLGEDMGNYLVQVNIIDPKDLPMKWALPARNIWRGGWKYFTSRIKTLHAHASLYRHYADFSVKDDQVEKVHQAIQATVYGDLASAYVSPDLGAMCVGLLDTQAGTSVSCKLPNDKDLRSLSYLDWIT